MALSLSSLIQEGGLTRDRNTFLSRRARLREQSVDQANETQQATELLAGNTLLSHPLFTLSAQDGSVPIH